MPEVLQLAIGAILVNNFVLTRFLGICPFLGVSRKVETATGMGMAVIFVMTMAATITWIAYRFVLIPLDLTYLQTIVFILVIASLVQLVEMVLQKQFPALYEALGIFLPLITTNCAILGVAVLNIQKDLSFISALVFAFSAGVGFTLALVLMGGLRERIDLAPVPEPLKGVAIALVTAGLLSLAFMGFSGLIRA